MLDTEPERCGVDVDYIFEPDAVSNVERAVRDIIEEQR
jgi:hypothetical protein